jgi:hypothetical protein
MVLFRNVLNLWNKHKIFNSYPSQRRLKVVSMRNLTFEKFLFQQGYHGGDWLSRVKGKSCGRGELSCLSGIWGSEHSSFGFSARRYLKLVGQPRRLWVQLGGPFAGDWVGAWVCRWLKFSLVLYFENCGFGLIFPTYSFVQNIYIYMFLHSYITSVFLTLWLVVWSTPTRAWGFGLRSSRQLMAEA